MSALAGLKVLDCTHVIAGAYCALVLADLGADVIKIEPPAGESTRALRGGGFRAYDFVNRNKRAIALDLATEGGAAALRKLAGTADVFVENYRPGSLDRMGLGYERLKEINPRIVYVQQSGMGQIGLYGQMRSFGPVAQAFSGMSEMSGLPEPFPPAGIGYSFLDWVGAYNMANAILAGLYRQKMTGKGCWIDACQVESGIYMNGTSILNFSANGEPWRRCGNRSPFKPAAPHGAYRTRGKDRWIAIACFSEAEWKGLVKVLGNPAWAGDARFASLEARLAHQDQLDAFMNASTANFDGYALMESLQRAQVPAGVCQTAEDRCDNDPQLKFLDWLIERPQSAIGTWPVKDFPVDLSLTPAHVGDPIGRHGPSYAEDNEYIYGEWLGFSAAKIRKLEEDGII